MGEEQGGEPIRAGDVSYPHLPKYTLTCIPHISQMLVFMAILAALQEVGMLAASLTQTKAVPTIPGHVTVCVPYSTTTLSLLYWIFPTIAHSFIFLFSFVRAWEGVHVQHSQAMTASKLYKVMISSYGLLFMASIIVIELTQIFFWLAADSMLKAVSGATGRWFRQGDNAARCSSLTMNRR